MKTAVVVQARVGSKRLPGKVLLPLGGITVLENVLYRCRAIPGADVVVCAIPDRAEDDVLIPLVERAGAMVARGSSTDVLSRYEKAATLVDADVIMRVTSDCPLIDPGICGEVLACRAKTGADFACNNDPPSFPHGLDCEAFTIDALRRANRMATAAYDREHVSPWLSREREARRATVQGPGGASIAHRWTLDYPEDYKFLEAVFTLLPRLPSILSWRDVLDLLASRPEVSAINSMWHLRHI